MFRAGWGHAGISSAKLGASADRSRVSGGLVADSRGNLPHVLSMLGIAERHIPKSLAYLGRISYGLFLPTPLTMGATLFIFGAFLGSLDVAMNLNAVEVSQRKEMGRSCSLRFDHRVNLVAPKSHTKSDFDQPDRICMEK